MARTLKLTDHQRELLTELAEGAVLRFTERGGWSLYTRRGERIRHIPSLTAASCHRRSLIFYAPDRGHYCVARYVRDALEAKPCPNLEARVSSV